MYDLPELPQYHLPELPQSNRFSEIVQGRQGRRDRRGRHGVDYSSGKVPGARKRIDYFSIH